MNKTIASIFSTLLLCGYVGFLGFTSVAQEPNNASMGNLLLLLEEMMTHNESNDIQQLLDELSPLLKQPIPINEENPPNLKPLFFLSPLQQNALLNYRERYGHILSPYELALIDGFDEYTAKLTALFLNFNTSEHKSYPPRLRQEFAVRTSSLLEQQAGYASGKFEGNRCRLYLRYRGNYHNASWGFTGEKDPGESFFRASNAQGFDYQSAFVQLKLKKIDANIILGDYIIQWGQGLSIWQGFSTGKSSDSQQIARFNEGIKPYSSTNENNFMRGLATQYNLSKNWTFMAYLSYNKVDAHIDTLNHKPYITTLQNSGLHRTSSEIQNEQQASIWSAGTKLNYKVNNLKVGLAYHNIFFGMPVLPTNQIYNNYLFSGSKQHQLSLNYQYNFNKIFLFGETSSNGEACATLNGLLIQPASLVSLSFQQRIISKMYNALYASAQTESTRVNDEHGYYIGMHASPLAQLDINAYADFFRFNWIKYTTASPSNGKEYLLQASYQLNRNCELSTRYTYENKAQKVSSTHLNYNLDQIRQAIRWQIQVQASKQLVLRSRFEFCSYELQQKSKGILIAQDIGQTSRKEKFSSWFRVAYFHTDDYNSRIYAYENDLSNQFSTPAFYNKGFRSYFKLNYHISPNCKFEVKLSNTKHLYRSSIGSGLHEIAGNNQNELKLQLEYFI